MTDLYYWEFEYIENVRKLYMRKTWLEKKVKSYMPGCLVSHTKKGGKVEQYHHIYDKGKRIQKYLSAKRDIAVINELSKKKVEHPVVIRELNQVNSLIKTLLPTAEKIISSTKITATIYPPSFSENPLHPEWLKYKTNRGEVVRSISERIIADTLYKYGLDYKYEKTLNLNGVDIHPDFTIINPFSGLAYYWEHLGLNTEEYIKSWHKKLAIYAENKINMGDNLIISTQEDINSIENMVREWFTMERYKMFID